MKLIKKRQTSYFILNGEKAIDNSTQIDYNTIMQLKLFILQNQQKIQRKGGWLWI